LGDLACIKAARSSLREAIAFLAQALNAQRDLPPLQKAETQFLLAEALAKQNSGSARAVELAREAEATYAGLPEIGPDLAEVREWLARHRGGSGRRRREAVAVELAVPR
jgi:hypothetical protein